MNATTNDITARALAALVLANPARLYLVRYETPSHSIHHFYADCVELNDDSRIALFTTATSSFCHSIAYDALVRLA